MTKSKKEIISSIVFISQTHNFPHDGEKFTVKIWPIRDELESLNIEELEIILDQLRKDSASRSDWT